MRFLFFLSPFADRHECIRRAERFRCKNVLAHRQVKCEINFIPLVHSEDDKSQKQVLQCREKLKSLTFSTCGAPEDFRLPCSDNSARCLSWSDGKRPQPKNYCTYDRCDHAVLVSGGWNSYTSRPRHRQNLRNVWKLLHSTMRYKKDKIVTFFGQGEKEEREYRENFLFAFSVYFSKEDYSAACLTMGKPLIYITVGKLSSKSVNECSFNRFITTDPCFFQGNS